MSRMKMNNPLVISLLIGPFLLTMTGCAAYEKWQFDRHYDKLHGYDECGHMANMECLQNRGWTFTETSIEKIDKQLSSASGSQFKKEWDSFKSRVQPGDQVWFFSTPPQTKKELMGSEGYMLLRDGAVITEIITVGN